MSDAARSLRALDPLGALDLVRVRGLRALGPIGATIAARREVRVACVGVLATVTALATSTLVPLWAFAFGPLLLGVPHVLADVRYLVVRPGLLAAPARLAVALSPVLAAWAPGGARGLAFGVVATAAAVVPGVSGWRRGVGVAVGAGLVALGVVYPYATGVALLHLHNVVAIGFWLAWRRRRGRAHLWVVAAVALGAVSIGAGAFDRAALGLALPVGIDPSLARDWLGAGLPEPWGGRLVRLFVYLQALHYAVWLRLVPEEDRARESARTYRREWRELVGDVGPLAWVAVAMVGAFLVWGLANAGAARDTYLQIALFHGFLELGVASWWVVAGARPGNQPDLGVRAP